jgi:hypothetical protein
MYSSPALCEPWSTHRVAMADYDDMSVYSPHLGYFLPEAKFLVPDRGDIVDSMA